MSSESMSWDRRIIAERDALAAEIDRQRLLVRYLRHEIRVLGGAPMAGGHEPGECEVCDDFDLTKGPSNAGWQGNR
jgi:hypothetical protein